MKTLLETEHARYNTAVKSVYQLDQPGFGWVLSELDHTALIPHFEIPSNETLCGHAVIFEPNMDVFE